MRFFAWFFDGVTMVVALMFHRDIPVAGVVLICIALGMWIVAGVCAALGALFRRFKAAREQAPPRPRAARPTVSEVK